MSDDKKTEKKGFFSRIFGGLTGSSKTEVQEKPSVELPSPSAIKAMKKADIVSTAKEHGLELDITNTKAQLLESWENHFSNESFLKDSWLPRTPGIFLDNASIKANAGISPPLRTKSPIENP